MAGEQVFISYARPTQAAARLVAQTLRGTGRRVWMDEALLAHGAYGDSIARELDAADVVLVLWSAEAVRSDWVRAEANRGREAAKLVQASLEPCSLPMPFDQIHCIDLSGWTGDPDAPVIRRLLDSIAAASGKRSGEASPVAPRAAPVAEQRQVTVLACAMALADPPEDPEDLLQLDDAFLGACEEVIPRHGGTIMRRAEAQVTACFGWPTVDEEEAANAVRAAVELRDAIARAGGSHHPGVSARVGVATGRVLVGQRTRSGSGDAGVVGAVPQLAESLAAAAPAGGIRVSEPTFRLTSGIFTYAAAGAVGGTIAHDLLGLGEAASRSQARAERAGERLFGRDAERAALLARWEVARAGEGQVALLSGEAGIGKSALLNAVCADARGSGGLVVRCQCAPGAGTQAFHSLIPGLRALARLDVAEPPETAFAKVAAMVARVTGAPSDAAVAVAELLGVAPPPANAAPMLTPERRRAMVLETIIGLMAHVALAQPVLFAFEDLHWSDPSTLELLDRAVPLAIDQPWFLVATARPEFQCSWGTVADLTEIALSPLAEAHATALAAHVGDEEQLAPDLMRQLVERAGGNPLFLEEITRAFLERGGAGAAGPSGHDIPETLQDTLVARLDRLGEARKLASLGAVIGRAFDYALIAAVAERPVGELRQALRELVRARVLDVEGVPPTSRYSFRHALIRDAALGLLPRRQRQELHGRIAAALASLDPLIAETNPAAVAEHVGQSATPADAIPLWAGAAARSVSAAAYHEAAAQFRLALDLLRAHAPSDQATETKLQLLVGLAVSLSAVLGFTHEDVAQVLDEARRISEQEGDEDHLLPVLRNLASFAIMRGEMAVGEELAAKCMAIAERTNRIEHRIHASELIGYIDFVAGRFAESRAWLEKTLALTRMPEGMAAPRLTPQDPASQCLSWLQLVYHALGAPEASLASARELAERVSELDSPYHRAHAGLYRSTGHFVRGDHAAARAAAEEAISVCEEHGVPAFLPFAQLNRLHCEGRLGNAEPAVIQARAFIAGCRQMGVLHFLSFSLSELALSELAAGDYDAALSSIDGAVTEAERLGEGFWLAPIHLARARILEACDAEPKLVMDALRTARAVAEAQGAQVYLDEAERQLEARLERTG